MAFSYKHTHTHSHNMDSKALSLTQTTRLRSSTDKNLRVRVHIYPRNNSNHSACHTASQSEDWEVNTQVPNPCFQFSCDMNKNEFIWEENAKVTFGTATLVGAGDQHRGHFAFSSAAVALPGPQPHTHTIQPTHPWGLTSMPMDICFLQQLQGNLPSGGLSGR